MEKEGGRRVPKKRDELGKKKKREGPLRIILKMENVAGTN